MLFMQIYIKYIYFIVFPVIIVLDVMFMNMPVGGKSSFIRIVGKEV